MSAVLESVRPAQVAAAADVLVESHVDYPAFRHLFPALPARRRALRPFFRAAVGDGVRYGAVSAAWQGGRIVGVAVWLPPGAFPWTAMRKLRAVPRLLQVLVAAPRRFTAFTRLGANLERAHPDDPHWYLVVLGIRREAQRQGLGTQLLEPVLVQADAGHLDCYLETADRRNVPFYERLGFSVEAPELVVLPHGPAYVSMRRRPRGGGDGPAPRR